MEIPWMALRGSGAFPAGLGGFLSTPAGRGRGRRTDQAGHGGTAGTGTPQKPPPEPLGVPPTADVAPQRQGQRWWRCQGHGAPATHRTHP